MKKLMFVAALAAALTGYCDLESQNICGYQTFTLRKGTSFFIPTFKGIATKLTLGEIKCTQTNGAPWQVDGKPATKCNGAVSLQKTDLDGNFLTTYRYISVSSQVATPGWYYSNEGVWTDASDIVFKAGEGFIIKVDHDYCAMLILKKPISDAK